ncbi:MAG TPA: hypothetical protein PK765_07475 [bacterium]|nr:hypothetical protein [bacterium]
MSSNASSWNVIAGGCGSRTSYATDTWYHVAYTWDGSTYRIFVDGVLDFAANSTSGPANTSARAFIGYSNA